MSFHSIPRTTNTNREKHSAADACARLCIASMNLILSMRCRGDSSRKQNDNCVRCGFLSSKAGLVSSSKQNKLRIKVKTLLPLIDYSMHLKLSDD